jgi:DNA polymerase-3 subunit epsilon
VREIVLDTETTGLSFSNGDRITEIGCVEILDKKITGRSYHAYVNPEREVSKEAADISGLTFEFLKDYGVFKVVAQQFLDFINDDKLVIHNAPFDIGFLNFELSIIGEELIDNEKVVDTLVMARNKYPGSPATLDALCRKFNVDRSARVKHGALIDASLLAEVYIAMTTEVVQKSIFAVNDNQIIDKENKSKKLIVPHRSFALTDDEAINHEKFISTIQNPIWNKFSKS